MERNRHMSDYLYAVFLGLCLFVGVGGGVAAGVWWSARYALDAAGEFVEEAIKEVRLNAFELLSNKTVQQLASAAERFGKKGGGVIGQLAERFIGGMLPPKGGM